MLQTSKGKFGVQTRAVAALMLLLAVLQNSVAKVFGESFSGICSCLFRSRIQHGRKVAGVLQRAPAPEKTLPVQLRRQLQSSR